MGRELVPFRLTYASEAETAKKEQTIVSAPLNLLFRQE